MADPAGTVVRGAADNPSLRRKCCGHDLEPGERNSGPCLPGCVALIVQLMSVSLSVLV